MGQSHDRSGQSQVNFNVCRYYLFPTFVQALMNHLFGNLFSRNLMYDSIVVSPHQSALYFLCRWKAMFHLCVLK
jgi:hypothetical protein